MGQTVMTFSGTPGMTVNMAVADVVDNLEDEFDNASGYPAIGAIVTCEAGDVRFTMGGNITTPTNPPTQGPAGLGHILYEGQSLYLSSGPAVRTFQFIAATNKLTALIQVTALFERGVNV
jgi:hypothetical protein